MPQLRDIDIRIPLLQKLKSQNEGHSYRIIPEMAVCDGVSRVDVAVANGRLCGYEIKSDADTLDRLSSQQESYNKTFDRIFIVVGKKFEDIIAQHIPDWWGIYVATFDKCGEIVIKERKRARKNENISPEALLELLWRDEIEVLLKEWGVKSLYGKNRRILRSLAIEHVPLSAIKDYTRETLKNRAEWRPE